MQNEQKFSLYNVYLPQSIAPIMDHSPSVLPLQSACVIMTVFSDIRQSMALGILPFSTQQVIETASYVHVSQ